MSRHNRAHAPDPLWMPVAGPIIWSTHFTICYIWAALACGRFAPRFANSLDVSLTVMTAIALAPIAVLFMRALRQLDHRLPDRSNDDGTPEDRATFMSYMSVLLAGLSGIGTIFVGVASISMGGCQ